MRARARWAALAGVLVWGALADTGLVRHRALAGPLAVLAALVAGLRDGALLDDATATLARVLAGVLAGALVGLPLGLWLGGKPERRSALEPGLDFLRAVPPLLLFPLLLLGLGYGESARVAAVAWASGLVVALHAAAASAHSNRRRRDVLRAMGAGWIARVRWLHLHELAPPLLTALRHALGTGMIVAVVTEMVVGVEHGLGARAVAAQIAYDAPSLYAVIVTTGGLALALSRALSAAERWAQGRRVDPDQARAAALPPRSRRRWAFGAGLAIAAVIVVGIAARSTFVRPEPAQRVVDRVRDLFP